MTLEDIPVGYQDIYEGKADEAIEGPRIANATGEGSQSVELVDTKTIRLTVRAGASPGSVSEFDVVVDGHIGTGEVDIVNHFDYKSVSPDATEVSFAKTGREKIPV